MPSAVVSPRRLLALTTLYRVYANALSSLRILLKLIVASGLFGFYFRIAKMFRVEQMRREQLWLFFEPALEFLERGQVTFTGCFVYGLV